MIVGVVLRENRFIHDSKDETRNEAGEWKKSAVAPIAYEGKDEICHWKITGVQRSTYSHKFHFQPIERFARHYTTVLANFVVSCKLLQIDKL